MTLPPQSCTRRAAAWRSIKAGPRIPEPEYGSYYCGLIAGARRLSRRQFHNRRIACQTDNPRRTVLAGLARGLTGSRETRVRPAISSPRSIRPPGRTPVGCQAGGQGEARHRRQLCQHVCGRPDREARGLARQPAVRCDRARSGAADLGDRASGDRALRCRQADKSRIGSADLHRRLGHRCLGTDRRLRLQPEEDGCAEELDRHSHAALHAQARAGRLPDDVRHHVAHG